MGLHLRKFARPSQRLRFNSLMHHVTAARFTPSSMLVASAKPAFASYGNCLRQTLITCRRWFPFFATTAYAIRFAVLITPRLLHPALSMPRGTDTLREEYEVREGRPTAYQDAAHCTCCRRQGRSSMSHPSRHQRGYRRAHSRGSVPDRRLTFCCASAQRLRSRFQ